MAADCIFIFRLRKNLRSSSGAFLGQVTASMPRFPIYRVLCIILTMVNEFPLEFNLF